MPIITHRPLWFTARIFRDCEKSSTPLALINRHEYLDTEAWAVLFCPNDTGAPTNVRLITQAVAGIQASADASQLPVYAE